MERKAKTGISALLILGIGFSILGAVYLAIAVASYFWAADMVIFYLTFGGVGLVFLIIGIVFLVAEIRKRALNNRLLNSGNYITAEISEVQGNYSVSVNRRHPFIVLCQYRDRQGNVHIFKSRDLYFNPSDLFKNQNVKVYVDGDEFKHYYVDIDEVLPKVIEH